VPWFDNEEAEKVQNSQFGGAEKYSMRVLPIFHPFTVLF
jgi:hypothetical protein